MFRELCGDSALKNVVLATSMWGYVSVEDGEDHENKLSSKFFKSVLDKGARMARYHTTTESVHNIIRMIMGNHPIVLQIQRELVDGHWDITDTAAGEAVNRERNEQMGRHQVELKTIQKEMEQASKKKDAEVRQELEEERRNLQEERRKLEERMEKTKDTR